MTTVATTAPAPTAALAAPPAWRRLLTLARHALEASLIWLLLLAAWLAAARYLPLGHNPLIPAPDVTLRALVESLPELWTGTLSSFSILLPGFGLACLVAIPLGFIIGMSPLLRRAFDPFIQVLKPISPLAWMPLALYTIKDSSISGIFVIFICSVWPMLVNTAFGVASVKRDWLNVSATLEVNAWG